MITEKERPKVLLKRYSKCSIVLHAKETKWSFHRYTHVKICIYELGLQFYMFSHSGQLNIYSDVTYIILILYQ